MPVVKAEQLTYSQVRELDKRRTLCLLPVSALEVHGPHLPLGMDYYMARWMAEEPGRRFADSHPDWTVIQYPALTIGTDELPLGGTMDTNQKTVFTALRDHGRSFARAGFQYVVVTNGHGGPRHAAALEAACREVSRDTKISMFTPSIAVLHAITTGQHNGFVAKSLGRALTEDETEGLLSGEHAGTWETSFMLAQNPDLVDEGYKHLQRQGPPVFRPFLNVGQKVVDFQNKRGTDTSMTQEIVNNLSGGLGWILNTRYGYSGPAVSYKGVPAVASAEIGEAFKELLARECLTWIEDVTSGKKTAVEVRSIASDARAIQPKFWSSLGIAGAAALGIFVLLF